MGLIRVQFLWAFYKSKIRRIQDKERLQIFISSFQHFFESFSTFENWDVGRKAAGSGSGRGSFGQLWRQPGQDDFKNVINKVIHWAPHPPFPHSPNFLLRVSAARSKEPLSHGEAREGEERRERNLLKPFLSLFFLNMKSVATCSLCFCDSRG